MDKANVLVVLQNNLMLLRSAKFECTGEESGKIATVLHQTKQLIAELSQPETEAEQEESED